MPLPVGLTPIDSSQSSVEDMVSKIAREMGVDPKLAHSIAKRESSYNPKAKSKTGAMGVMQLEPATAKEMGVKDPWNPEQNIRGGLGYLKTLLMKYKHNPFLAAAAYNAGGGLVDQFLKGSAKLPEETRNYLHNISQDLGKPIILTAKAEELPKGLTALPKGLTPITSLPKGLTSFSQATNPMDEVGPSTPGEPSAATKFSADALSQIAGHQDIMYILLNAMARDESLGSTKSGLELINDPNSYSHKAFNLWKKHPSAAMDEYGAGSLQQEKWMKKNGKGVDQSFNSWLVDHPTLNGMGTFFLEMFNPVSIGEGGAIGKAAQIGHGTQVGSAVENAAQTIAHEVGLGSPFKQLADRGGLQGVNWVNAFINRVRAPEKFLHMENTDTMMQKIFGGLHPDEQKEVVAISQGHTPDPKYFTKYNDLKARADLLRRDISSTIGQQARVGLIDRKQSSTLWNQFFPTDHKELYKFDLTPAEHENPGNFNNVRNVQDPEFLPAETYSAWRNSRLQMVGFEDGIRNAPASLRLLKKGNLKEFVRTQGKIGGNPFVKMENQLRSPALRRSFVAPELSDFLVNNEKFKQFIERGTSLPHDQDSTTFLGRMIAFGRNAILSNFGYHPIFNVSQNESVARGLAGLGGARPEFGGQVYNFARAIAQQIVPEQYVERFATGAEEYTKWLDRALAAGAAGELGTSSRAALGSSRARILTVPGGKLRDRAERALTKFGIFNKERTFGKRGEEAFAVSLFRDAVEHGGMSDDEAAALVRHAFHDYNNLDPNSPTMYVSFFMPWRKSNTKFWVNVLAKKPQYVTAPAHAIRNFNQTTSPDTEQGPYAKNPYVIETPFGPWTPSFVGRSIADVANLAGSTAKFDVNGMNTAGLKLATGSFNPLARLAYKDIQTEGEQFQTHSAKGPETNFNLLWNPKAPDNIKRLQAVENIIATTMPVPLVGFIAMDMMRRGTSVDDIKKALPNALGLGFPGSVRLTKQQQIHVSLAQRRFLKVYDGYVYGDVSNDQFENAWQMYWDTLKANGVVNN